MSDHKIPNHFEKFDIDSIRLRNIAARAVEKHPNNVIAAVTEAVNHIHSFVELHENVLEENRILRQRSEQYRRAQMYESVSRIREQAAADQIAKELKAAREEIQSLKKQLDNK